MSPAQSPHKTDAFETEAFETAGGVHVARQRVPTPYEGAIDGFVDALDSRRGAVFSSNYEYPGRYTRWDSTLR